MLTGTSASKVARSRDKEARSRDKEAVRMARGGTNTGAAGGIALPRERGKLDRPVPLSEFAKAQKTHTGHGRRDALTPGERTRVLRMLRDEGGRLADEDSQVFIGAPPPMPGGRAPSFDFDFDDSPPPQPVSPPQGTKRPTMQQQAPDAKQAVIVGLAQAMAKGPANKRSKRQSDAPPTPGVAPMAAPPPPPSPSRSQPPSATAPRTKRASAAPPPGNVHQGPPQAPRRPVPPPFSEEPTRQVTNELLAVLRSGGGGNPFDEEDSTHNQTDADPTRMSGAAPPDPFGPDDDDLAPPPQTSRGSPHAVTGRIDLEPGNDESTAMANIEGLIALERANRGERPARGNDRPDRRPPPPSASKPPPRDETTRAIDLRNDGSISDVDWDLD
jgi:hypothetical protein